jgi:4-hydroxybenzoate polyprenyltransferase
MQDNFGRLVKICFYGMLILIGFLAAGAEAGSFGVPAVLGIALFLILIAMQFTSRMMKSRSETQGPTMAQTFAANKGGVIMLLVIALATIVVVFKAFG